ncbi:MAG: flagellar M-ring protein FliF C-terminal domain-containing protein [Fimbriimonas sp.]
MAAILQKLRSWWENSDRSQKVITLGGLGLLVFLMAGTFFFATRPKYSLLFSGMTEADKNTVVTEIQALGIPVKYDVPGQVEIPSDKIGEVNMKLAGGGKLPKSAHPGIADLDKMTLFSTPAQERERLKIILEGELAKSIESLDAVQAARVHITLGSNSPFVQDRTPPTASVSITENTGAFLSADQARAVASLVANACEGMDIGHVTVLNQRMEVRFDGTQMGDDRSLAADRLEMEKRYAKAQEREIQQKLDAAFGPGSTLVSVNCVLDLDKQKSSVQDQKPTEDPINTTKETETLTNGEPGTPAAAGAVANTPTEAPAEADDKGQRSDYKNQKIREDRGLITTTTDTEKATGGVKSMTINVLANTDKIQDLTAVQQFLGGEVKNRADDPINFPLPTVTGVKFDTSAADAANRAQAEAAAAARQQQMLSMVPVVALLLVAMMVVRQIGKFAKPAVPADGTLALATELPIGPDGTPGIATMSADGTPMLPDSTGASTAGGALTDDETDHLLAALRSSAGAEVDYSALDAPEIKDKVDLPLESLRRMADDRPQIVGQLIKSMLLEDRK